MSIYRYEEAFGASDKTTKAMRKAIDRWFSLYYDEVTTDKTDTCQRLAYTVVGKLIKTVFGEYKPACEGAFSRQVVDKLDQVRKQAMELALIGGEAYLKPCMDKGGFFFGVIPRNRALIFARDLTGMPTDMGLIQVSAWGNSYYTLLERRSLDGAGCLTIQNRLFKSASREHLGQEVSLNSCPVFSNLAPSYRYEKPLGGIGLVCLRTPMFNCVDGSNEGVSIYAAAAGLIDAVDENEAQLRGEFTRGQSRIIASRDMLRDGTVLEDHLFVGLDEDPDSVGITVFSPNLRQESYIARKQEYLRNVESIIGLKRGMLSDANTEDRTATEIASSASDYNLTVIDLQGVWQKALNEAVRLCGELSCLYGKKVVADPVNVDWGNGVLYDEDTTWTGYLEMVNAGILKPEIALAWRFNLPCKTPEDMEKIRRDYIPERKGE